MHINITNIIPTIVRPTLIDQTKILEFHITQVIFITIIFRGTFQKLIKYMKITFPLGLVDQTDLFEEVRIDGSTA